MAQKGQKQVMKTKAEILEALQKSPEMMHKMQFIKSDFWPALEALDESIEDVQNFLAGFNTALMQEFLNRMKDVKFGEMKLAEKLSDGSEKYKDILALFADMSVFDAKEYIEGMKSEIELFRREEDRSRKLSTLQTKWLDEA